MAFKLSKADVTRRDELAERLDSGPLLAAIETANAEIERAVEEVNKHIAAYNEVLAEAREFAENIATTMREQFDEKSERWQDSDAGQAVSTWVELWEGLELDDVDLASFEPIEEPETEYATTLGEAPAEP